MPHPADFVDAHHRHREDAELLFQHDRWANADQLYGFSAECGLKAVMKVCGMPVDGATGMPTREYREHLPEIWPIFQNFVEAREYAQYWISWRRASRSPTGLTTTATRRAATAEGRMSRRIGMPSTRSELSLNRRGRTVYCERLRFIR